jgi:hypothetical protein
MKQVVVQAPDGSKFNPATFAQVWNVGSVSQENQHGKFYNLSVEYIGLVQNMDLYAAIKDFRTSLGAGHGKVDYNEAVEDQGESSVKDGAGF